MREIRLGGAIWGVLIGLGLAIAIAACAQSSSGRAPAAEPAVARTDIDPRKQDIEKLWGEIRQWRKERGMTPDPLIDLTRDPDIMLAPVPQLRQCPATDEPPKSAACDDVCNLRDDICDNAESICRIADQLGDDDWARNKCKSAKASCKEATDKCCGCESGRDQKRAIETDEAKPGGAIH
jgi:hypothetical protein